MERRTWHEKIAVKQVDFFQLARLFKLFNIEDQAIKFVSSPTLAFATSDVTSINKEDEQYNVFITFMGLVGQTGILPDHFTELMLERVALKDKGLQYFLNVFEDRLVKLFYKAWEQSRFFLALEQGEQSKSQKIINLIHSLTGQPMAIESETEQNIRLFYSGLYAKKNRPGGALATLLSDYFSLPVKIIENQGKWFQLELNDLTQLSNKRINNQLGINAVLGQQVWYIQNQFRIQIGTVNYHTFKRLLPNEPMLKKLRMLVSEYIGMQYQFVLEVIVDATEVPVNKMQRGQYTQLGWNSWLNRKGNLKTNNKICFSDKGYDIYEGINNCSPLPLAEEGRGETRVI